MREMFDIAVIGGGVNGCGVARDAAGRGLSVLLAERDDLGSGTSSASTKLIHGGLRYLEHYEFRLVREALKEREVLLRAAPHIIWPMRFVLPHLKGLRPWWLIRLGLFLYDHLGGREILPGSRGLNLRRDPAGALLKGDLKTGFEYSDCWVEDSRLVVLTARDAADRGAVVRPRTEVLSAERNGSHWSLVLQDRVTGRNEVAKARILVNAAGPWVAEVIGQRLRFNSAARVRLVKGSHIVTRRLFDHDRAYIFQNPDRRIIFAIPYERDFTLIGTTDIDYHGNPAEVAITPDEIDYLCTAISEYFIKPVTPEDVVWSFSGVRPLYDDGKTAAQEATRDFVLELEAEGGVPPLLSIFGGKITTYRRLAEEVLERLSPWLAGAGAPWTRDAHLPGGDFPVRAFEAEVARLQAHCSCLDAALVRRYLRAYGTLAWQLVKGVRTAEDLGEHFGGGLYEREIEYLAAREWAMTADDVLWRRSKLGLRLAAEERARVESFMGRSRGADTPMNVSSSRG